MATYNKFQAFVENVAEGVHDLGADQMRAALTNTAPAATNSTLANITEISYTNITENRNITTSSSSQTTGTYTLVLADLTLNATGAVATFRYPVLYNDTPTSPADPLIGYWDHGSAVTLANGESYTMDFSAANGVLQIA